MARGLVNERRLESELLDVLPTDDPRARASRRDLRRLNSLMANAVTMARQLARIPVVNGTRRVAELGAGDGAFMLSVARRLPASWLGTRCLLLDRHPLEELGVRADFKRLGWDIEFLQQEVGDWLEGPVTTRWDAVMANLFLHHFSDTQLPSMLRAISLRTDLFIAVEPRRSAWALLLSQMVGLIGCNVVTRHDAPVSVRAGFNYSELSRLWPSDQSWSLREHRAGLLAHLFVAQR
jgi:hypothetical protein